MDHGALDDLTAKVSDHEAAAHQRRNWVRLTFDCNDRCIFCLDSHTHDGTIRAPAEVKEQILSGRRAGAERLILSGGEPTIHPNFVDFVRLGRLAGYERVQTVTNGRMFAYPAFLKAAIDAGLGEITFSIHGPNAKIHDALVGTRGAFDEEMKGLRGALDDGRVIVNIDVCVNRANVRHLPDMLRLFIGMGVREFDLLHIIPFGRAYTEGKEILFYDLAEARPFLQEAFALSKEPGVHIWLNRFPPQHIEGYEHLIQDPYKLSDEVRGRQEEYARLLDHGVPLDCRAPQRCRHCYLQPLCDELDHTRARLEARRFSVLRLDHRAAAEAPVNFGGDPASRKRARGGPRSLPILSGEDPAPPAPTLPELARQAPVDRLWLVAPDLPRALALAAPFSPDLELELELDDLQDLLHALVDPLAPGGADLARRVRRILCDTAEDAARLLAIAGDFEVVLALSRATAPWLLALDHAPPRLILRQPSHERLTESAQRDVDLLAFFAALRPAIPVEGVPACVLGRPPRSRPQHLDGAHFGPHHRLEIFRFTRRYIADGFFTKPLRCGACVYNDACPGLHINYVRAHGYAAMQPITRADPRATHEAR
jgi:pyruvate-formate lyase-activating enzyme